MSRYHWEKSWARGVILSAAMRGSSVAGDRMGWIITAPAFKDSAGGPQARLPFCKALAEPFPGGAVESANTFNDRPVVRPARRRVRKQRWPPYRRSFRML